MHELCLGDFLLWLDKQMQDERVFMALPPAILIIVCFAILALGLLGNR